MTAMTREQLRRTGEPAGLPPAIDPERLEAFRARFGADQAAAMHLSTVVLGDQLGLYQALAAGGPQTGDELAARAGYVPRLVLEWLRAQAVSGYCEHAAVGGGHDRNNLPPLDRERVASCAGVPRLSGQMGSLAPAGFACRFGCLFARAARVHKAPAMSMRPMITAVQ